MSSDVTCEKLRDVGAELALGVLPARERAGAVAHLEQCADCREYVAELTQTGDRLIGLLPCSEPPVGFETRVAQALTPDPAAHDGRSHLRASGTTGPQARVRGRRSRARTRIAAAAGVLALVIGFGGWAIGTAIEDTMAGPPLSAGAETNVMWAGLTAAQGAVGKPAGEVYAHPGSPGWIYMSVDLANAGVRYDGKVECLLLRTDGTTVSIGSFAMHQGEGSWGGPAGVDPTRLAGARLTAPDGTVLARAHFASSHEA